MLTNEELKQAKFRYYQHLGYTKDRVDRLGNPIQFKLMFEEWLQIWLDSGHWKERGNKQGQYVMSRYNDLGHYEVGNVFIQLHSDNVKETFTYTEMQDKREKMYASNTWKDAHNLGTLKRSDNQDWQNNLAEANRKKALNPVWRQNNRIASQTANSKAVICHGIRYSSITEAGKALAPPTARDSWKWLAHQLKIDPTNYYKEKT